MNEAGVHMKGGVVYAIVGPSEAGKSTMLALIKVFYKPNHGHVLFNGIDISTLSSSYVRSLIGYVEHDAPHIFRFFQNESGDEQERRIR